MVLRICEAEKRKVERLATCILALVATAGFIWLWNACQAAILGAVEIGCDEHYEVSKGFLWAKGHSLYSEVWNDQPPLHTVLLGLCFKIFGTSIIVARALAVAFGLSLLVGCAVMVGARSGMLAAGISMICLIAAPQVFELSISAMLELPAFAMALWALGPVLWWQKQRKWPWLMLSGMIMAMAMHIKLTAALVAPALLVEIMANASKPGEPLSVWKTLRYIWIWVGSWMAGYMALMCMIGATPLDVIRASHYSQQVLSHAASNQFFPFWPLLSDHPEALWGAGGALVLVWWRRDWRRLAFPLAMLGTVILVHMKHRPWWPYYYLHLAIPLAWLTGYLAGELMKKAWTKGCDSEGDAPWRRQAGLAAGSIAIAVILASGSERLASEVGRIRMLPRIEQSALISKMRQYANGTHWVYTRQTIYAFHAGLPVVPELAVMPAKRFWSGQITDQQIGECLARYKPEQLLLTSDPWDKEALKLANAGYAAVYQEGGLVLYVAKSLDAHER